METRWPLCIYLLFSINLVSQITCIQYTPVNDITNCALMLSNPMQYSANLLSNDFGGQVNCITYDAINQAYINAMKRIDTTPTGNEWDPRDLANVGEVLLDITYQIAQKYNLNAEQIEYGLRQIDTLKTAIKNICPVYLSSIKCKAGKYRRPDGLCNNVNHPTWGAINTPFTRLLPPHFADHISAPKISTLKRALPSARVVSRTIHRDEGYHDHAGTTLTFAWGQFMDHDLTLMGTSQDARTRNEPEECCNRPQNLKNPYCMEITVSKDDYFYAKFNVQCQDFVRTFPAVPPNCRLGSRNPFNTLTAVIDGNTVYGVTEETASQLRSGVGGQLKMNPAFENYGLKDLLPIKTNVPDENCVRTNASQFCFLSGESRVNEQITLTCMHTMMAREHNRIASELAQINPHWSDEILYQEAKRITVAEIQHVTFSELLPIILGKAVMEKYDLILNPEGYWDGYDSNVNPGILDAFSAAAFRFGHSLLPSSIERWSKLHKLIASRKLSDVIRRPFDLYRAGVIDEYFGGLINQVAQAMDDSITQEVTNKLFKKNGKMFGLDLVSFNIQRGRDFGLPGYMYYRKFCGLPTVDSFSEMFQMMPNSTVIRYSSIYETPWDIDLWSGGVSENPLPGSLVGPTFACIIATQMNLVRRGDRFWYELPNQPSSFTLEQLLEIKKVKLSRLLCDNSDLLDTVQIYAMVLPDHDINPRVPCKSSIIPKMNLMQWADVPSRSFDGASQSTINNEAATSPVISNQSTPFYEYHVKTIAIIEGSNSPINVNDLLSGQTASVPSLESREQFNDHHLFKRHATNVTVDTILPPSSKDGVKRNSHEGNPYPQRKRFASRGMTQAIIKQSPSLRSRSTSGSEEENIEGFFRKNVPIYDGVSKLQKPRFSSSFQRYPSSSYFGGQDEEDEEEKDKPLSVEEVDPEHDSQYEHVPMIVDHEGKQKVMDLPQEDEEEEEPYTSKPYKPYLPPKYHSSHLEESPYTKTSSFPVTLRRPSSFDRPPTFNHPNFGRPASFNRPSSFDYPPSFDRPPPFQPSAGPATSYLSPPTYGTSHQYNSLTDDKPRYYKHFPTPLRKPDSPPASDYDEPSYSPPTISHFSREMSPHGYRYSYNIPSYNERSPTRPSSSSSNQNQYRTSHVPQTLEEYHQIHNTFGESKPVYNPQYVYDSRYNSPRNLPVTISQDEPTEEEDEKEEKDEKDEKEEADDDKDNSIRSKPFVFMNFKTFGSDDDDDDGVSIHHQLTPGSHSSVNSYIPLRSDRLSEGEDVEYPALPVVESSEIMQDASKFKENSEAVKSFVDSIFNKNKALEMGASNANREVKSAFGSSVPLYNFGDRVKVASKPAQNTLWHRKDAVPKERSSTRINFDKLRADFAKQKRNTPLKNSTLIIEDDLPVGNEISTVRTDLNQQITSENPLADSWAETHSESSN